jgi:enoyl-CoA hydratase
VCLTRRPDGVALITLNRPKGNALSGAVLESLSEVIGDLAAELPGAVVLWGGPRVFAVGADVTEFEAPGAAQRVTEQFHAVTGALAALPRVTLAAICGYALGGGLELALACDLRVAGHDAKLGQPEVHLGVLPGGGGTQRLARLVGPARAKDLIFTGRTLPAEEALALGVVDRVVAREQVLEETLALASQLAQGPVVAHGLAKAAIDQGLDTSLADGLRLEREAFVASFATQDARRGIASFLHEGPGKATFVGR